MGTTTVRLRPGDRSASVVIRGQRYLLAELLRIDAELLVSCDDRSGAVDTAERAIRTAVEMRSPWLRDRALATLSALPDG